eukprot:SM000033S12316  [mRNA]  locus=s33:70536:72264:- [translate_table: standard]
MEGQELLNEKTATKLRKLTKQRHLTIARSAEAGVLAIGLPDDSGRQVKQREGAGSIIIRAVSVNHPCSHTFSGAVSPYA